MLTYLLPLTTRDTVIAPTPASCATSATVGVELCVVETLLSFNEDPFKRGHNQEIIGVPSDTAPHPGFRSETTGKNLIDQECILVMVAMSYNTNLLVRLLSFDDDSS